MNDTPDQSQPDEVALTGDFADPTLGTPVFVPLPPPSEPVFRAEVALAGPTARPLAAEAAETGVLGRCWARCVALAGRGRLCIGGVRPWLSGLLRVGTQIVRTNPGVA